MESHAEDERAGTAGSPLLRLRGVGREFDGGAVVALRSVDFVVRPGENIGIVGPSGSGKSSLVQIMGGCDIPTRGAVFWRGRSMERLSDWAGIRGVEVSIVFQDYLLLPTLTATENVELTLIAAGVGAAERRRRAADLLERVGLAQRRDHLPSALSGGERQRVAIARSLANRPALLLADEPTGNLDSVNSQKIADLLFEVLSDTQAGLVLVTHDPRLAGRCSRQVRLRDGEIVGDETRAVDFAGSVAGAVEV